MTCKGNIFHYSQTSKNRFLNCLLSLMWKYGGLLNFKHFIFFIFFFYPIVLADVDVSPTQIICVCVCIYIVIKQTTLKKLCFLDATWAMTEVCVCKALTLIKQCSPTPPLAHLCIDHLFPHAIKTRQGHWLLYIIITTLKWLVLETGNRFSYFINYS